MIKDITYKVGIYLRLSREDEKLGESSSISTQRAILMNYIKENNLIFVKEYKDDGVSGTTFNRIGFNHMIKDCEEKKINMIITKDTSRLGRDHIEFGYYVEKYFPEHNIRYVAVNDGIDTFKNNSANDMLVFKSVFNDMYVKDISNKLRSSLYIKKKNGQFVGSYAPYGYKKSIYDKHKLEIDEQTAHIVKRIFNMFKYGYSVTKICNTLTEEQIPTPSMSKNMNLGKRNIHYGVWSPKTVTSILKNPTYIGNLTQCRQKKINYKSKKRIHTNKDEWIISENSIPKIIDKYSFELVNNIFKSNENRYQKNDSITDKLLLRGLIFCKECHHTIGFRKTKQITKKNGLVYRIYGNCNYWVKRKKQNVCTPHSVKYKYIEKIVLNNLKKIINENIDKQSILTTLKNTNKLNSKKNNIKMQILNIKHLIDNTNKKIDMCYNDKLDGNITLDIYIRTYKKLTQEINNLKNKNKELEKELLYLDTKEINNNYYQDKIDKLLSMENPSRTLISLLINKIEIDEEKNIDIHYNFYL